MQTIAELFKLIPLWNSYKLCPLQHVASLESLITLLTLEMLNYNLTITLVMQLANEPLWLYLYDDNPLWLQMHENCAVTCRPSNVRYML